MRIKDCMFGQVRKIGSFPKNLATDLHNDLSTIITKQEIMTWDNATGMNPLWYYFDKVPNVDVTKMSYGKMLAETYDMGIPCVTSLQDSKLSAAHYDAFASADPKNKYSAACKRLGQWWHIHHLLNRPDALDYDFTIFRQTDTIFEFDVNRESLKVDLIEGPTILFQSNRYPADIPMIYELGFKNAMTSYSSFITWSHAFIFNRAAVKQLQSNFYELAAHEANRYFELIGENNYTMSIPAVIITLLAVKQDVEMMSVPKMIIHPTHARGQGMPDVSNYARVDRAGM